jgi:2-oxoisovalerate dehydrogenase E1 component
MPSTDQIKEALLIRNVENSFLELFSQGKINGTIHTSVGQEFSAIAFAGQLRKADFVFSNHRCHGHYIAFTKDARGLIAELLGKKSGTCAGIGSSQHLQNGNFFSNGIQGGIAPIAAGMALAKKIEAADEIGIVFIGDGTLGEGVIYETLNIISLWKLPLLVVCENNYYAQSTKIEKNLAGDIKKRAEAFGIATIESSTEDVDGLLEAAKQSITRVRSTKCPIFFLVNTYRLNPHSKGDDTRDLEEISGYRQKDFLCRFQATSPELFNLYQRSAADITQQLIAQVSDEPIIQQNEYLHPRKEYSVEIAWRPIEKIGERQVTLLNRFFDLWLQSSPRHLFIGEDVLSPYGGAFKVANGLSARYPRQVLTTPISEAAITGLGNGLALAGFKPVVEIMFGDFITLALDQIINHASKFYHMYNRRITCPLVVRTPMGGRRRYGPTHSQTLDRLLIGIDNVCTVALNVLLDPAIIYGAVFAQKHPVVVIENKADYGKQIGPPSIRNYISEINNEEFPIVRIRPELSSPTLTIVTYGGMVSTVVECVPDLFHKFDLKCEIIVLSCISPINYRVVLDSVRQTKRLVMVEEGTTVGGIGSEIISSVVEMIKLPIETLKIGAEPVPIPSVGHLEDVVLPSHSKVINSIAKKFA